MSRERTRDESRAARLGELSQAVRANQRATDLVDELAGQLLGVSRSDGRCLDILEQHGRLSAGELAREARLTSGAITAVIDRLERGGYVQRVADRRDRRRVLVEVTDKTRAMTREMYGPLAGMAGPLLARYSDEQLELLIEFNRLSLEVQERHADFLRARLGSGRDKPASGDD